MNNTKMKYKSTLTKVGVILLIFVGFLTAFMSVYLALPTDILPEPAATIIDSVIYDVAYLAAFMLPVLFVKWIFKPEERQPMRLDVKLSWKLFAYICIGVSFTYIFSYINAVAVDFVFDAPVPEDMFNYAPAKMSNGEIILQFITADIRF
jgi:membrane protease YdiL (CAAX protease family)